MDEKEINRAKKINYAVLFILFTIIIIIVVNLFIYKYNHTFTTEKWLKNPRERVNLVDDLLSKHHLVGMNEKDVLSLLGKDSGESAYFQEDNNFVYYLGDERGFISIDSEWLIIEFSDGIVTKVQITTD